MEVASLVRRTNPIRVSNLLEGLRQKIEESQIDYSGTSETGLDEVLRVGFLIQREPSES